MSIINTKPEIAPTPFSNEAPSLTTHTHTHMYMSHTFVSGRSAGWLARDPYSLLPHSWHITQGNTTYPLLSLFFGFFIFHLLVVIYSCFVFSVCLPSLSSTLCLFFSLCFCVCAKTLTSFL